MDVATTQHTDDAPPHQGHDDPQRPLDRRPVVTQRRIMKLGAVGSPVRRSPRLSCLPPPQLPVESRNAENSVESSDDESASINDVALHLSRDETPEDDALLPDEPSTVLAKRIIRAHDNPSPPPRGPGIDYVPGKYDQLPQSGVSMSPSPLRPMNIVERLNESSDPFFDPLHGPRTPTLGVEPEASESGAILSHRSILPSPATPVSMKATPSYDLESTGTIPSSSQAAVRDHASQSPQHVCGHANLVDGVVVDQPFQPIAEPYGQSIITTGLPASQAPSTVPIQAINSSINHATPSTNDLPQGLCSDPRQSGGQSLPSPSDTKILSSLPPNENDKVSGTEAMISNGRGHDGEQALSNVNNNLVSTRVEQECNCKETSTEVDSSVQQGLGFLSPYPTNVPCRPRPPTSPVEETILPAESTRVEYRPVTPPRTLAFPVTRPDISRASIQRPVNALSPMRAKSSQKLNSPTKLSLDVDDIYRTPAQRVPIETSLLRVTSSVRGTGQLSTEPDQYRLGRFMTIKAPVFTRPALDDPSRSPAKRIPITEIETRRDEDRNLPTRSSLRARSTSVEPRPLGAIHTRSRSAEPHTMTSNAHHHGRMGDSIFPMVVAVPRAGTRLPFPLVSGQKSSNDLPSPISEGHENAENGPDLMSDRESKGITISRLRQPSTNSRIPRVGSKPYARPQSGKGRALVSTKTADDVRSFRASPFQLACKNSKVGNSDANESSAQPAKGQRLMGSLKRKRGAEATAPSDSHPVIVRQVVPGIIGEKYGSRPTNFLSQVQVPLELSPLKPHQPVKFRKVVDGMLSARYAKANLAQTKSSDSTSPPPSPLSELSSSSNEGSSDEKSSTCLRACPKSEISYVAQTNVDPLLTEPSPLRRGPSGDEPSDRPRRTSRARKPSQQQYVIDIFNDNTSTRTTLARRKPQSRTEGGHFMGMSAMALKALTTSNTTKNQQTVAVLATEVIRKEGLRPESPAVKARTILQKQRDERDVRRREREQRKAQLNEGSESREIEGRAKSDDRISLAALADHDENDYTMPQKHCRGPGDEEDYETPERPGQIIEPLRIEGAGGMVRPLKQVKWHRGLSTSVCLDEIHARSKSLPKNTIVRGCLAPTAKNLPLDPLGNLVDINDRPSPELMTERIVVKRYIYDDDIDSEAIVSAKITRSKSKKSRS